MLLTSSSEDSIQRWGLVASEVTRQQCSKQKSFRNKADGERKAVHGLKHERAGHYFVRKESRQCGNQEISWILQTTGYEEMKEKNAGLKMKQGSLPFIQVCEDPEPVEYSGSH